MGIRKIFSPKMAETIVDIEFAMKNYFSKIGVNGKYFG